MTQPPNAETAIHKWRRPLFVLFVAATSLVLMLHFVISPFTEASGAEGGGIGRLLVALTPVITALTMFAGLAWLAVVVFGRRR